MGGAATGKKIFDLGAALTGLNPVDYKLHIPRGIFEEYIQQAMASQKPEPEPGAIWRIYDHSGRMAPPLVPPGWKPICALCGEPVESFSIENTPWAEGTWVRAICHGEAEQLAVHVPMAGSGASAAHQVAAWRPFSARAIPDKVSMIGVVAPNHHSFSHAAGVLHHHKRFHRFRKVSDWLHLAHDVSLRGICPGSILVLFANGWEQCNTGLLNSYDLQRLVDASPDLAWPEELMEAACEGRSVDCM